MPDTAQTPVALLSLDLENYRTTAQPDEVHAFHALVTLEPNWFWGLTTSLLDDGYLPTENIIVLSASEDGTRLIVKEGNRRVAAMKLILGLLPADTVDIPADIRVRIETVSEEWKTTNAEIPCTIYPESQTAKVDQIVARVHGKGDRAGRLPWTSVSRARHNRDENGAKEPAFDLLDRYLHLGRNVSDVQREIWGAEYPLTVLEEAGKRLASRFGVSNARELADKYPSIPNRDALESILADIGTGVITFKALRDTKRDIAAEYGVAPAGKGGSTGEGTRDGAAGSASDGKAGTDSTTSASADGSPASNASTSKGKKTAAAALTDPKAVKRALRKFAPRGDGREKLVVLRKEAVALSLEEAPLAFCFLLRSMFEISAKAYCAETVEADGPKAVKADGEDRRLVEVLKDVAAHIIAPPGSKKNRGMEKHLHGALSELADPVSFLSVTSMNQLIHHPTFVLSPSEIAVRFWRVFPLLAVMNHTPLDSAPNA